MSSVIDLRDTLAAQGTEALFSAIVNYDEVQALALLGRPLDLHRTLAPDEPSEGRAPLRPLELALLFDLTKLACALIAQGAPLDSNPDFPEPMMMRQTDPFRVAARRLNKDVLEALRTRMHPNRFQLCLDMELTPATMGDDLDRLRLLVGMGAQCTRKDEGWGYIPLHHAAAIGNTEVIDYLLAQGSDWHAQDIQGNTPAHFLQRGFPALAVKYGVAREHENVVRMVRRVKP